MYLHAQQIYMYKLHIIEVEFLKRINYCRIMQIQVNVIWKQGNLPVNRRKWLLSLFASRRPKFVSNKGATQNTCHVQLRIFDGSLTMELATHKCSRHRTFCSEFFTHISEHFRAYLRLHQGNHSVRFGYDWKDLFFLQRLSVVCRWCQLWSKVRMSEVAFMLLVVTYGRNGHQWVKVTH